MTPAFRSVIAAICCLATIVMCLAAALGLGLREALFGAGAVLCSGAGAMLATHYLIGELADASEREDDRWQEIDDRHPAQMLRTIDDRLGHLQRAIAKPLHEPLLAPGMCFVTNRSGFIVGVAPLPEWSAADKKWLDEAEPKPPEGMVFVPNPEPTLRNSIES